MHTNTCDRRGFIAASAAICGGLVLESAALARPADPPPPASSPARQQPEEAVSPAEDLMREHGIVRRVLLIYTETLRRLDANQDFPPQALKDSATIVHNFIHDYHEKLEEDYLFPRFRKAGRLVDLVNTLQQQHDAGRRLTETTFRLATSQTLEDSAQQRTVGVALKEFIRMYRPHASREDTVLFPAFRKIVSAKEYDELGDQFEDREHDLFGEDGFEKMVDRVAAIEKDLGIYDLARFTPEST